MSNGLKSDIGLTEEHSGNLLNASLNLAELPAVESGDTNHEENAICQETYTGLGSCLESYLEAAERDAERIKAAGLHFLNLDIEIAHGM